MKKCLTAWLAIYCLCMQPLVAANQYGKEIAERMDALSQTPNLSYEQQIRSAVPPELLNQVRSDLMKLIKPLDKPLHVKVCLFDILGQAGPSVQPLHGQF